MLRFAVVHDIVHELHSDIAAFSEHELICFGERASSSGEDLYTVQSGDEVFAG